MVALSQREEVSEGDRFIVVPKSFDLFWGVKAELGINYV